MFAFKSDISSCIFKDRFRMYLSEFLLVNR